MNVTPLIKDSITHLLHSRSLLDEKFTDTDWQWGANKKSGVLASLQGLRTVFGVIAALGDNKETGIWEVVDPYRESLFKEMNDALHIIDKDGYNGDPYDDQQSLKRILEEYAELEKIEKAPYIDTVSWSVSSCILFNYILPYWQYGTGMHPPRELIEKSMESMIRGLRWLVKLQCHDGGWNLSKTADGGHLYFTWSVIESLADFYDYVMGESQETIGVGADEQVIAQINHNDPQLISQIEQSRNAARDFLAGKFLKKAIDTGLSHDDLAVGSTITSSDPGNTNVLIYYDLYLLESLILCGYDVPGGNVSVTNREELRKLYKLITTKFASLRTNTEFKNNPDLSSLVIVVKGVKPYRNQVVQSSLKDPGLWAQLLRTMILYRYYTDPIPNQDPDILGDGDSAWNLLMKDRRPVGENTGDGLWDSVEYNLSITVRSIEGLIDVSDYLNLLDMNKTMPQSHSETSRNIVEVLADAIYPLIAERIRSELVSPAPVATISSNVQAEIAEMRYALDGCVRKQDFDERMLESLGDALFPLDEWKGVSQKLIATTLLGKQEANNLNNNNPRAYKLIERLSWLSFCVAVRLIGSIFQEAVFNQSSSDNEIDLVRQLDEKRKKEYRGFAERIQLVLKAIFEMEYQAAKEQRKEPIDYAALLRSSLQTSLQQAIE